MSDEEAKVTIACRDNGPYMVSGLGDLRAPDGSAVETKPMVALCRCGGSAKKPFCDGTHARNGFDGAKHADRAPDQRQSYVGNDVTIHDNRALCAHAGVCTDNLSAVWRQRQEPWIDPDGAAVADIIDVIGKCPSGALSYSLGGAEAQVPSGAPSIQAAKDGPFVVSGDIELEGQAMDVEWGDGACRAQFTLCRCGASKNKPFCDGSHWSVGFKDDGSAG